MGAPAGSRFDGDTWVNNYLREKQLTDERIAIVEKLGAFAKDHGHSLVELASDGRFGLRIHDGLDSRMRIRFCPWCGAKLKKYGLRAAGA